MIYQRAFEIEIEGIARFILQREFSMPVFYKNQIGERRVDFLVEQKIRLN